MAIVLFILHSAFAFAINPIFLAKDFFSNLFVMQNGFDLKVYFPYAFGLTFAFAITAIIDYCKNRISISGLLHSQSQLWN